MQLQNFYAQDVNGNIVPGAICSMFLPGTTTLATGLQDVNGVPLANPFAANSDGLVQFAAPNGKYDLKIEAGLIVSTLPITFADTYQALIQLGGFLPPSATPPTVRADGTPLQLGDRYMKTPEDIEYIYKTGGWEANNLDGQLLAAPGGSVLVGNGIRTVGGKLSDIISVRDYITTTIDGVTSNQTGIVDAVAAAKASGSTLYWPAGTYVSTASIPDFHSIPHFGDGVIKRGTDTFKMNQRGAQRNIIYVATTGSDLNDGLSAAQPFATVQAAATAVLFGWESNLLNGAWRLQLAAGTYGKATVLRAIKCAERFQVFGPEVSWGEPTAIIDNTLLEDNVIGLYLNTLDRWEVRNVKFTNFTGTRGIGVSASNSSDFYCANVWADNCGWSGIYMQGGKVFRIEGGKLTNCREGAVAYTGVIFTIGYNSSAHPTLIQNCSQAGFSAYNSSSGHVDYAEVSNCSTGVAIINNSRVDFAGTKIMGCGVAIGADGNSNYIKNTPDAILFNSGSPNTTNERCRAFSIPNDFIADFTFLPLSRQMRFGNGWSGATPVSTYKWIFEQQAGDPGIALLASGTETSSYTFGRPGSGAAGRLTYDHSVDWLRIIANNAIIYYANAATFRPASDGVPTLGAPSARWSTVYAATGTINTSDEDAKTEIKPIDEACLRAWARVEYAQYKFKDSVEEKGLGARWHFGAIAQRVKKAFEEEGLNAFDYALLCYDEWEEKPPVYEVRRLGDAFIQNQDGTIGDVIYRAVEEDMYLKPESENGEVLKWEFTHEETVVLDPGTPAGSRYGIRYEEALALECAYLRSKLPN